jgi:hypothetical protein
LLLSLAAAAAENESASLAPVESDDGLSLTIEL